MVHRVPVLGGRLGAGLGALHEREYRLLFGATLTTSLGGAVGTIALAFAVLDVAGATSLGIVIAVRQGASAAVLLFGGVLSDRARRNLVLVGASLVQGAAQAATAAIVLAGVATVPLLAVLGVLWGLGDGLVVPAEAGLVPQTVSPARLQQANALQGLSRSGVRVIGPALGGILVVALNPGWALAVDSASFFVCAALLARMRIAPRAAGQPQRFVHELRAGWREFTARTWLWSTVLLFGIGNVFFMFMQVLGPAVAKERLGGAGAWAAILTVAGVGAIAGGVAALRQHPSRPLVACVLWPLAIVPQFAALAAGAPTWVVAACAFAGGFGIADPRRALVHDLPTRDPRARAIARRLLRRLRVVRPQPARRRDRGAARRRPRHLLGAVARRRRAPGRQPDDAAHPRRLEDRGSAARGSAATLGDMSLAERLIALEHEGWGALVSGEGVERALRPRAATPPGRARARRGA